MIWAGCKRTELLAQPSVCKRPSQEVAEIECSVSGWTRRDPDDYENVLLRDDPHRLRFLCSCCRSPSGFISLIRTNKHITVVVLWIHLFSFLFFILPSSFFLLLHNIHFLLHFSLLFFLNELSVFLSCSLSFHLVVSPHLPPLTSASPVSRLPSPLSLLLRLSQDRRLGSSHPQDEPTGPVSGSWGRPEAGVRSCVQGGTAPLSWRQ